jgi:hypothetical protein
MNEKSRTRVLLFVVDASRGTIDGGIEAINRAIRFVFSNLHTIEGNHRMEIVLKTAVLEFFDESAEWTLRPTLADNADASWGGLQLRSDAAKISVALDELNEKLSDKTFFCDFGMDFDSAIILLAGHEFDAGYVSALNRLKNNEHFKDTIKNAVPTGKGVNTCNIDKFVGVVGTTIELVPKANNAEHLYERICKEAMNIANILAQVDMCGRIKYNGRCVEP